MRQWIPHRRNFSASFHKSQIWFIGNHLWRQSPLCTPLGCARSIEEENLQAHAIGHLGAYEEAKKLLNTKQVKGRGLMLGLEFDFEVGPLRKELIYTHHILGGSSNKKLLRILPPLTIQQKQLDFFLEELKTALITSRIMKHFISLNDLPDFKAADATMTLNKPLPFETQGKRKTLGLLFFKLRACTLKHPKSSTKFRVQYHRDELF